MNRQNAYKKIQDSFGDKNVLKARHTDGTLNVLGESEGFIDAFQKEYGLGRENWAESRRRVRKGENKAENSPRIVEMIESHPGIIRTIENLGLAKPGAEEVREGMGMGLEPEGRGRRIGQLLGAAAGDLPTSFEEAIDCWKE